MAKILVVYSQNFEFPPRISAFDHIYAFHKYSSHTVWHLNIAMRRMPGYIRRSKFDMIIFHTSFLSQRWLPYLIDRQIQKLQCLKDADAIKVALPQDEFIHTDILCKFINDFKISHIFSVSPPSEWPRIYADVDRDKAALHKVLTGYLSEQTIKRILSIARRAPERQLDIGYRAAKSRPWLGRHGLLKVDVAEAFLRSAAPFGLKLDISTPDRYQLLGDAWLRFLLTCKYTIGVEGGASLLDHDGSIRAKVERYLKGHPEADFEQVEANCFPGRDGELRLFAISPRHLEACATRTCQILVEGDYDHILEPGRHYIELKRDFSNIEDVLAIVKHDELRHAMTERAYTDIVQSGKVSYKNFARFVVEESLNSAEVGRKTQGRPRVSDVVASADDALSWLLVAIYARLYIPCSEAAFKIMRRALPVGVPEAIQRWVRGER